MLGKTKKVIEIPSAPRVFNLGAPFPTLDNIVSLCDEIVRGLHDFQALHRELLVWKGQLTVHDQELKNHNRIMYYAAYRHFERKQFELGEKIQDTLKWAIDGLYSVLSSTYGCTVDGFKIANSFELKKRIKIMTKVDVTDDDVRDFHCNFSILNAFRSECMSVFYAIITAQPLPSPLSLVRRNAHDGDAAVILDGLISWGVCGNHRRWLQSQRKGIPHAAQVE